MKWRTLTLAGLLAIHWGTNAATIDLWDFNSSPPDGSGATGTLVPAVGFGTASLVGGTTGSFAAGTQTDPGSDNTGWSTAGYPAVGAGNKTAGIELRASTRGYSNITVSWEQRLSGSASRYLRLQYSPNGTDFIDSAVIEVPSNNTYYARSASLATTPGTADNPNFAVRLVTEFVSTATGAGVSAYATPLGGSYSGSGTIRFDVVRITGDPVNPQNAPPSISVVPDLVTIEDQAVSFSVELADDDTPPGQLLLRLSSSNTNLIPAANVILTGTGSARTLVVTPAAGQSGEATITILAADAASLTASQSFKVTVTPKNAPPFLAGLTHQRQILGAWGEPIAFTVGDTETAPANLTVTAASSNPDLIGSEGLVLGGSGASRTLRLVPVSGVVGSALVTVQVTDGGGRVSRSSFVFMVVPSPDVFLWETFGYPDGSLVTNSAHFWGTHGGATGQVEVAGRAVPLSSSQTEDVHVAFANPISTGRIYWRFEAQFSGLPGANEYFAHLNHASGFRARVFAGTNQAAPGSFRLGIGNGSANGLSQVPVDLLPNTPYVVVVRYDTETASSSMGIDPQSESDLGAVATDTATAVGISSVSFRNNSGIGSMKVAGVRVGRTFGDIMGGTDATLGIVLVGPTAELSWGLPGYRLQVRQGLNASAWEDEPTPPEASGNRLVVRLPRAAGNRFFRLIK